MRTGEVSDRTLPAEFIERLHALERSYLRETDPIRGSGFGGGHERWRAEREPLLDGVSGSGDLLDVGCANGYLLACLIEWAGERGFRLIPHGVDIGPRLVDQARARLGEFASNMHVGNAWTWHPPRRYDYVYSVYDCVPEAYLGEYVNRLLDRAVKDGGRLIIGSYGSRSGGQEPFDIAGFLESQGHVVSGTTSGGRPVVTRFAWIDKGDTS